MSSNDKPESGRHVNMRRSSCVLFTALALLVTVDSGVAADMSGAGITAFADVTVVPMDRERVLKNWTVVVADGRIRDLGSPSREQKNFYRCVYA